MLLGFLLFDTLFQNVIGISPEFRQNIELEHLKKGDSQDPCPPCISRMHLSRAGARACARLGRVASGIPKRRAAESPGCAGRGRRVCV